MDDFVYYNGELFSSKDSIFNAENRAFLYGDGLFETISVVDKTIQFWDLHINRLKLGCLYFKIPLPDFDLLFQSCQSIVDQSFSSLRIRLKIIVFREAIGYFKVENQASNFVITVKELQQPSGESLLAGICPFPIKFASTFSSFKTLNALPYILAGNFMQEKKWEEIIILNQFHRVCEGLYGNIFWRIGGEIYTPPISEGCIDGVMRKHLLTTQKIIECVCHIEDLKDADEIFVTNVIRGKYPIELL